jgi:hypothetical protein
MGFGENSIELNEQPKKVFGVGGFLSGATFPWGSQMYSTFDSIRQSDGVELKEYLLNNKALTPLDIVSIPFLYHKTRRELASLEKLQELQEQLDIFNPDIIVGHSLGCYFLEIFYRLGFVMPSNVKEIRYYQADVESISNPNVINYHSPVDPVLYVAKMANMRSQDAGLYGDPNHNNNIQLHPNLLDRHTGLPLIDLHLSTVNKVKL